MLKNLSVKAKLSSLLTMMSVLLLVIGFLGLYGMNDVVGGLRSVYQDRTVPLEQLGRIRALMLWNRIAITAAVANPVATLACTADAVSASTGRPSASIEGRVEKSV